MFRLWTAFLLVAQCLALELDPVSLQGGLKLDTQMESQIVGGQMAECARNRDADKRGFRPRNNDMDRMRNSKAWGLKEPLRGPPAPNTEVVKMAFLIFADDRVENEEIWLHWMAQAHNASLHFAVHVSNQSAWRGDMFREHVVPDGPPARWCKSWDAQMSLIRRALQDQKVTHLVILSGDSVPVKPMAWMYSQAHNDPLSRFCVDDYWRDPWPRAETWSVLRRDDAMLFDNNMYFAEQNFRRNCEDQLAWYFPLRARWDNFGAKAPLKRECIMFANWKDGHDTCQGQWAKTVDSCDCRALRRRRRSNSTPADYRDPVAYHAVSEAALEDLVRSPFWFARRFTEGAVPQKLANVLDIDLSKPRKRFKLFR